MPTFKKRELTILYPYRAFHNQEFNSKVLLFLLLPPLFNILTLVFLNPITQFWGNVYEFFMPKLGYDNAISYIDYNVIGFPFSLPYINIPGLIPSMQAMEIGIIACVILILLSMLLSPAFTPLKYFIRAFVFLLFTAIVYFFITPNTFPYDVPVYSKIGLLQIISLMFAAPWIYGFTYYFFSYKYVKKVLVTATLLFFFIIAAPLQYLLTSYIVINYSLLFVPPLYIFFGVLLDIFVIVAFYGYGVSLEQVFPQRDEA